MTDQHQNKRQRYWEIDALRGVAIIWMIGFHLTWDLVFYGLVRVHMGRNPWPWFSRIIATMFLTLAGISLVISASKSRGTPGFRKHLFRGARIFGFGLVITAITYFFLGDEFVVFGILHLIGFSIVAAYPFMPYRRRWFTLLAGIIILAAGNWLNRQIVFTPWLIWLGINEFGRGMADWYPILPWFGMVLVGIWIGHMLYTAGQRRFSLPDWSDVPGIRQLAFLGRHALLIYLIHQPLLVGTVALVAWMLSSR
ncbi:MAG: DUF1624 domain-containing protein [Anaerolineae bacterium]|nr:DUF1624 domain-containing protein [Anaerolineae bacterium]